MLLQADTAMEDVFPEATFNLEPLLTGEIVPTPASVFHLIQTSRYRPEVVGRTPQGCGCG